MWLHLNDGAEWNKSLEPNDFPREEDSNRKLGGEKMDQKAEKYGNYKG